MSEKLLRTPGVEGPVAPLRHSVDLPLPTVYREVCADFKERGNCDNRIKRKNTFR
ncbi:MAG: hypothetical protein OEZ32_11330 [Nitrospinota bacterium]|nr:hypothetical protein [Nitrospinota bacterium]